MTRSRVFIMRSRSDQNREIESREDNVSVTKPTQYRKETEFFELKDGYFFARIARDVHDVVMLLMRARRLAKIALASCVAA